MMKFQPVQSGHIYPTITLGNQFSSWQGGTGFGICLQNLIDYHWFKNVHKMMKLYKDICLLLSHRLTSCRKNTIEKTTIYWNVLLWIFSNWCVNFKLFGCLGGLKRLHGKILSWQSGILAVQKRDPALPGWNLFHVIARFNLWRIYSSAGIPAKHDRISSRPTGIM